MWFEWYVHAVRLVPWLDEWSVAVQQVDSEDSCLTKPNHRDLHFRHLRLVAAMSSECCDTPTCWTMRNRSLVSHCVDTMRLSLRGPLHTLDARSVDFRAVTFPYWPVPLMWSMVVASRTTNHPYNLVSAMMAAHCKNHLEIQPMSYFDCVLLSVVTYVLSQQMEFPLPNQFVVCCYHFLQFRLKINSLIGSVRWLVDPFITHLLFQQVTNRRPLRRHNELWSI